MLNSELDLFLLGINKDLKIGKAYWWIMKPGGGKRGEQATGESPLIGTIATSKLKV